MRHDAQLPDERAPLADLFGGLSEMLRGPKVTGRVQLAAAVLDLVGDFAQRGSSPQEIEALCRAGSAAIRAAKAVFE